MRSGGITLFLLLVPIFLVGVSCDKPSPNKKSRISEVKIDPVLEKIDTFIALMDLNLRLKEAISCEMVKTFQSTKSDNDFARKLVAESVHSCELARQYVAATKPTYEAIRVQGRKLARLYAFVVVNAGSEDPEEEIGLFADLTSCNAMETIAHERGEATRKCFEWKDIPARFGAQK